MNAPASATETAFEVRLLRDGRSFVVPPDRSILAVLREAGVFVPASCEQGICGTCLTRVVEGVPDHRDFLMTDDEHAANDQMTPCCSRAKSAWITLDL